MSKEVKWKVLKEYENGKVWEEFRANYELPLYWVQLGRYKNPPTQKQMEGWKDIKTKNVAYKFTHREGALMFADKLLTINNDQEE